VAERVDPVTPVTSSRKRVLAVVMLWAIVMTVVGMATGCYGRNCEGEDVTYGRTPGQGRLLTADLWESSPIDGRWLDFPKQRVYVFELEELGDREPALVIPYVSAAPDPLHDEGGQFTVAGGNLAEIFAAQKGRIGVKNGTCADYYLRVVVQAAPRPGATGEAGIGAGADAGAGAGAGAGDAGGDAEAGP
jgi:hypothetical protein